MAKQQLVIMALDMITKLLMSIGDVLFMVWIVQMVTRFEPHSSYPFVGIRGDVYISNISGSPCYLPTRETAS